MFLIRLNYNSKTGAGHYMRIVRLLKEIRSHKIKFKIKIILDKKIKNLFYENSFSHIFIYNKKRFKNEIDDAKKIKKIIHANKSKFLILDDYRLGYKWEKIVKSESIKLILIDDLINKKHICDYYINFKDLENDEKIKLKKNILVNDKEIIGHRFAIIDNKLNKLNKLNKIKKILFYPGNNGNPELFYNLIASLLNEAKKKSILLSIDLFLGKNNLNSSKFNYLKKYYKNFNIIKNQFNIHEYLNKSDLYFGFSGNSIYENSYLNLISFLFPISINQKNKTNNMEKLGHYLIFKKGDLNKTNKITKLFFKILPNISKIKKDFFKKNDISKNGAKNIIQELFNKKNFYKNIYESSIQNKYKISKLKNEDINQYLFFRNKKINRENMISSKIIENIDHYNWWFDEKFKSRNNFKIEIGYNDKIFIWSKIVNQKKNKYLIGGWFSSGKDISIKHKIIALNWQLQITKKHKIPWIAVIKKNNFTTYKLNSLIGFKTVKENTRIYFDIIEYFKIFPKQYYLMSYFYHD